MLYALKATRDTGFWQFMSVGLGGGPMIAILYQLPINDQDPPSRRLRGPAHEVGLYLGCKHPLFAELK